MYSTCVIKCTYVNVTIGGPLMMVDDSKRQGIQEIVSGKTMSLLCITAKKRQLATFFHIHCA